MKQDEKLAALRGELRKQGVDGFLVPRADEFMGEYVPACNERLKEVSGFSGSAGIVAVLQDSAVVVTDSRYKIQVAQEVDQALFDIKIGGLLAEAGGWLAANAQPGSVIGYDPRLHSPDDIEALNKILREKNVSLKAVEYNPLDAVWVDRPRFIASPVVLFPEEIAGRTSQDKRESIGAEIAEQGAQAAVLTEQASIAWLLNIRADDVPHTPFALSYAVLHDNGDVDWFIEQSRVSAEVREHLGSQVRICDPADLKENLQALAREATNAGKTVMLDEKFSAIWFKTTLEDAGAKILACEDPCIMPKARKTRQEQKAMRQAHLMDGVALTKFLCWLDREAPKGHLTELDVMDKLLEYRRENPEFLDTSFETIAGWNANGAIIHYRATPEKHAAIKPPGMLLLDSGGQYRQGTTDVTRTVAIGKAGESVKPSEEMKRVFTAVLRGHIGVASAKFAAGTIGKDFDIMARRPMEEEDLECPHRIGHPVEVNLSVHGDGAYIGPKETVPFEPGMICSNEPGYYDQEKGFGVRIESLVLAVEGKPAKDGTAMLEFDTITWAPLDTRLILPEMMEENELTWLNNYHARLARELAPYLDKTERAWLKEATKPVKKSDPAQPRLKLREIGPNYGGTA